MSENNQEVKFRKTQELLANYINSGAHKEIAKYHRALFDGYKSVGFDKEQALRLVIASIQKK